MIVFVEESYKQDSEGAWHYALAGFGIDEFRYRDLQAAVYQIVRRYFVDGNSYLGDAWYSELSSKIVTNKPVERVEIKASELLKPSVLTRFGGVSAPHYRLVLEILASVSDCRGTCFGVLVNPIEPRLVKDCSRGCPETYQHLIKMVGRWMEEAYPSQPVILALDTEENGVNLPLSRAIADYLYRSASGKRMKHVFPSPFWIDSKSMAGAQVADLVAHILMNSMLPQGERKQLSSLWQQVNSLRWSWENGSGGTIRKVRFMADGGETLADAD